MSNFAYFEFDKTKRYFEKNKERFSPNVAKLLSAAFAASACLVNEGSNIRRTGEPFAQAWSQGSVLAETGFKLQNDITDVVNSERRKFSKAKKPR